MEERKIEIDRDAEITVSRNGIELSKSNSVESILLYEILKAAQHRLHLTAFGVGMLAFLAGFGICWLAFVR
jgi:hypothetical protein